MDNPSAPVDLKAGIGVFQIPSNGNKIIMFDVNYAVELTITNDTHSFELLDNYVNEFARSAFGSVMVPASSELINCQASTANALFYPTRNAVPMIRHRLPKLSVTPGGQ